MWRERGECWVGWEWEDDGQGWEESCWGWEDVGGLCQGEGESATKGDGEKDPKQATFVEVSDQQTEKWIHIHSESTCLFLTHPATRPYVTANTNSPDNTKTQQHIQTHKTDAIPKHQPRIATTPTPTKQTPNPNHRARPNPKQTPPASNTKRVHNNLQMHQLPAVNPQHIINKSLQST